MKQNTIHNTYNKIIKTENVFVIRVVELIGKLKLKEVKISQLYYGRNK